MLKTLCIVTFMVVAASVFGEEPKPASPVPSPTPPPVVTASPITPQPTTPPQLPVTQTITRPAQPPLNMPRPQNQEWAALLERLRIQPRAGEINNGTVNATLADIFSDSAEAKTKSSAIAAEYEKILLEKSSNWERDILELRARYETKMLAELPEARREAAQKLLDMSRTKWAEAATRDAAARAEFLERMRNGVRPPVPGVKAVATNPQLPNAPGTPAIPPGVDASNWMRGERMKAIKQDEESVKAMRELLAADEVARLDHFTRGRASMPLPAAKPVVLPPAQTPPTASVVPPQVPPAVAPPVPLATPTVVKKDNPGNESK